MPWVGHLHESSSPERQDDSLDQTQGLCCQGSFLLRDQGRGDWGHLGGCVGGECLRSSQTLSLDRCPGCQTGLLDPRAPGTDTDFATSPMSHRWGQSVPGLARGFHLPLPQYKKRGSKPPGGEGVPSIVVQAQADGGGLAVYQCFSGLAPKSDSSSEAMRGLCGLDYGHQFSLTVSP